MLWLWLRLFLAFNWPAQKGCSSTFFSNSLSFFSWHTRLYKSFCQSVHPSITQCKNTPNGSLTCVTAPAHPYVTDAFVYTALFFYLILSFPFQSLSPPDMIFLMHVWGLHLHDFGMNELQTKNVCPINFCKTDEKLLQDKSQNFYSRSIYGESIKRKS